MPLVYGDVGQGGFSHCLVICSLPKKQCPVESHNHVRKSVGIFDVGHMVQSKWDICLTFFMSSLIISPSLRGQTVTDFLEWLTPSSLASLKPYTSTLSVLLNEDGGIIDDTIITKHASDAFYIVTNAGRRERDLSWFKEKLGEWNATDNGKQGPVELEVLESWGLLALQGKSSLLFYQGIMFHTFSRSQSSIVFAGINLF